MNTQNIIMVSVCMTAYNQAKYIVDAIEGVLMQSTTFPIELLIGEDCGDTDNTLEICREYESNYPQIIRIIHDGRNHGMVANTQRLMDASQGKYIAFCEADDYWIDSLKLQKQIDILEKYSQYSGCACQSRIIKGCDKNNWTLQNKIAKNDMVYTLHDLLVDYPFQTASFVFRASIVKEVDQIPVRINGLDRIQYFLVALRGDIYWLKDEMAVYRKNEDGISNWVTYELMKKDLYMIPWFKKIDERSPLNELKAHIYYVIMLNSTKISVFNLVENYCKCMYYANKCVGDMFMLKKNAKECFIFRLPRSIRRVMKKLKLL
jgi:glycosyltransferase involved in cell wall biosynthesis